jgi:hypothetical protein
MMDITVKVPEERVADFYSMYGRWLAAPESFAADQSGIDDPELTAWASTDVDLARSVWAKFTSTARALFSKLIDEPGQQFAGDELAAMIGVPNGRHGVAGVLAWPARHCFAAGRSYCWYWSYPDGETAVYWMADELAALFREARDSQ